ncbi:MAG: VOC family protein [Hyphomonadaceae bacterium]|nr:VOC family protein [Hyphomonadaceae bacterium]
MSQPAPAKPLTSGIHHVAYRCKDAAQTVAFYRDVLGMDFTTAFAEDHVPSTGAYDPYMHVFLDAGGGNVIAFFELPEQKEMGRDENTPAWVQHIAFKVESIGALITAKARAEAMGLDVLGPTDHGVFQSIYFFDPNGHRLELTADTGTQAELDELRRVAPLMLEEWSRTKKAPQHAAWLHEKARAAHAAAKKP